MKKHLFLFSCALLTINAAVAQINLTSSDYPASLVGTDSLKMTTAASAFPALTAMANATWDMSTVTDSTPIFFAYRVPTTTYQFADSNTYALGSYAYKGNVQSSNTSAGLIEYGINVQPANYSISSVTFGPTDTLYIPAQQDTFQSEQLTKIAFPATYHSSWSSVYNTDFNFQISVAFVPLSHAPGITKTYTTEKDSVTGWGKMRVKDASGSPSPYFNVLQVQTVIIDSSSFFINGALASGTLLMPLGLTQGQKDTTYQQSYYRVGEVTPLAQVTFKDAAYTQPTSATTHAERIYTNAVPNILNEGTVKVYPNPVTGNFINVALPATGGNWSYQLTDVTGKKVQDGSLPANSAQAQVALPAALTGGIYYLRVNSDGRQVSITPLDIVK